MGLQLQDMKQVLNRPPASSGRIDYLLKRLSKADQEMDRMFGEDRKIDKQVTVKTIPINIRHFSSINSWFVPAVMLLLLLIIIRL